MRKLVFWGAIGAVLYAAALSEEGRSPIPPAVETAPLVSSPPMPRP